MENSYDISIIEKSERTETASKIPLDSLPLSDDCEK